MTHSSRLWRADLLREEPVLLAPLALIAVVTVVAVLTPSPLYFSRFLVIAPALAASMWPVIETVALGLLVLAIDVLIAVTIGTPGEMHTQLFTSAMIAGVTAAAAYASHVRQQREEHLAQVRSVAETTQKILLRPMPHRLGRFDIDALYLAAATQARVGGDFYEALETPYGVRLIIGDVRGKGLPAVGAASAILGSFREAAYDEPDLARLARRLDVSMSRYESLLSGDNVESFATVLLAQFLDDRPVVEIVNCGHPSPLLLRAGAVREVTPTAPSPPINMGALLGQDYQIDLLPFAAGDQLLLYTDGVIETRDHTGAFFPLTQHAGQWDADSPSRLLEQLHTDLVHYGHGRLDDDIAVVAVRATDDRLGGPSSPGRP
ncbi:PP2C family protein-serine/threonine phosphatase [Streptosporangium pseudovulgare]|uniref:PP2C family protein-serine/threonine phosphatase n=1 Tax=Streptosporangium pseudovulgare TaxID=35765 RepID=UPI001E4F6C7F|nr:PP2C family protein-serine/threonine phosphatase [Streptosporangium pseudovulgare]